MRIAIAAAALGLAAPALAEPAAPPPSPAAALAFYPAAARAAGVEGAATIRCARNAHLALKDCTLVSEAPAGQGFGAAALAMAAKSPDNPDVNVTDAALTAAGPITIRYRPGPPQIDPDLTAMAHVVKRPQVSQQPSPQRLGLYYPEGAADVGLGGSGTVHCRVTRDGELTGCAVVKQTSRVFGLAAARVAEREYRMTPLLVDGKPTDQGEADLSIAFEPMRAPAPAPVPEAEVATDIKTPLWIHRPTGTDMAIAFPRVALTDGRSGAAVIRCVVDADGHLDPCAVLGEKPVGEGFASATLELAKRFQMQAKDRGGAPTAGRTIRIAWYFVVP